MGLGGVFLFKKFLEPSTWNNGIKKAEAWVWGCRVCRLQSHLFNEIVPQWEMRLSAEAWVWGLQTHGDCAPMGNETFCNHVQTIIIMVWILPKLLGRKNSVGLPTAIIPAILLGLIRFVKCPFGGQRYDPQMGTLSEVSIWGSRKIPFGGQITQSLYWVYLGEAPASPLVTLISRQPRGK